MISKILFSKLNIKRIAISSAFASIATLIYPFCTNIIVINILKILTCIIMLQLLGVKSSKHILLSSFIIFVFSYILGGAVLSNLGTSTLNGYTISNINLLPIFIITIVTTFICCKLVNYIKSKINLNSHIHNATLINNNIILNIKGFIDSGNHLCDNNNPVTIINFKTFKKLTNISLSQYLTNNFNNLKNAHFINANTISGKSKILVFNIDKLQLNNKTYCNISLGVSLHFDNSKEYSAIFNSCFCSN